MTNALRKYSALLKDATMVPRHFNNVSGIELAEGLTKGYKLAFGDDPSIEMLAAGWAQAVHESGWPVRLPNNNIGNIKANDAWLQSNNYYVNDTIEFTREGTKYIEKATKWRSYPDLNKGAESYWKFLGGNRYGRALDWMAAGDPKSASVVLGVNGYYTDSITTYANRTDELYNQFMKTIAPKISGVKSNPVTPPGERLAVKVRAKDYSKEEKIAINTGSQKSIGDNAVNQLMTTLYANEGKMTRLVKNSILKEKLPVSDALVCIDSDDIVSSLELARITASILRQSIDATAYVCASAADHGVEIQCSAIGTEEVLSGAIREICELAAKRMNEITHDKVSVMVLSGMLSKYSTVEDEELIKNRRHFNMNRVLNG